MLTAELMALYIKDLAELKSSLQFTQKDVEDLKPVTEQMTKIGKELGEVQAQVDFHCDKMKYLENHSRRNNIRIDGIPEEPDETWEDTESKAKAALESKLNLSFKVEFERAHRTGKAKSRPRASSYSYLSPGKLEAKGSNIKGREDCEARGNVCQ